MPASIMMVHALDERVEMRRPDLLDVPHFHGFEIAMEGPVAARDISNGRLRITLVDQLSEKIFPVRGKEREAEIEQKGRVERERLAENALVGRIYRRA